MPNFPANYAEQEKYYASEEYQSSAKAAIANNEPLPTYEKNKDLGKEAEKPSETPKSSAPLRYPYTKIDEHDDYMRIEVVKFTPPGLQRAEDSLRLRTSDEIAKKDIKHTIMLPVPQGVLDGRSANWSMGEMSPIDAGIVSAVSEGMNAEGSIGNMAGKTLSELTNQLSQLGQADRATIDSLLTGQVASMIASAITGNNVDAVGRETGLRINKNQQLLFDGVTGREFSFGWDIVPRSRKEAQQTKIILRVLKQAMSAQRGGTKTVKGLFIASPDIFYLTYMKGKEQHPFLNAFKPCALTNMAVNYTGSGTYATYHDGNPVHLNLSLSFRELTPIFREDYFSEESGDGVGY